MPPNPRAGKVDRLRVAVASISPGTSPWRLRAVASFQDRSSLGADRDQPTKHRVNINFLAALQFPSRAGPEPKTNSQPFELAKEVRSGWFHRRRCGALILIQHLQFAIRIKIAQDYSLAHRIDVFSRFFGLFGTLHARQQVFFEWGKLRFVPDHAQVVSLQIVVVQVVHIAVVEKFVRNSR